MVFNCAGRGSHSVDSFDLNLSRDTIPRSVQNKGMPGEQASQDDIYRATCEVADWLRQHRRREGTETHLDPTQLASTFIGIAQVHGFTLFRGFSPSKGFSASWRLDRCDVHEVAVTPYCTQLAEVEILACAALIRSKTCRDRLESFEPGK